jgi:site-specific DNA recombinase
VSSDPTGRAISVTSQDAENHAFCDRQGWDVERVITDNDRSASRWATQERPGYIEIRDALSHNARPDVLVCWESSRGHRDLEEWLPVRSLCERHGVLFAYSGRVYDLSRSDDRFSTTLDVLLSEREADVIRDRAMRGVRASAALGKPHGHVPYGYRRIRDERTGAPIEQVPDERTAPVVREIVARILAGDTLHGIAVDLNRRHVPTPQGWKAGLLKQPYAGGGWTSSKLRALFKNPTAAGIRSHREGRGSDPDVMAGSWPGIVGEVDYRMVKRLLADPVRAVHHRGVEVKHLLSGIATCGLCGAWMRPQRNRGVPSYLCGGHGPGTGKGHVCCAEAPLDAWVTLRVTRRLARPEFLAAFRQPDRPADRMDAARRELADAQAQLAEYTVSAGTVGGVSAAAFARIEARLSARIAELETQLAPPRRLSRRVAQLATPDAGGVWEQLGVEGRRAVLREVCARIAVMPVARRGVRGFDPDRVQLRFRGE